MIDYHVHIGQFNEIYYDALELFETIESTQKLTGITELRYSSTSTCREDVELKLIEEEINYAQSYQSDNLIIKPYLWFIPKYAELGINVESAASNFDYCGIKIHPIGQNWDMENHIHKKALHQIFRWADDNTKFILIHCGSHKSALPNRFESFFSEYSNASVILAHSNPITTTALMLNKYDNVYSDTACLEIEKYLQLCSRVNDKSKILFGSDFPVTNYFSTHLFGKELSLKQEYIGICKTYLLANHEKV